MPRDRAVSDTLISDEDAEPAQPTVMGEHAFFHAHSTSLPACAGVSLQVLKCSDSWANFHPSLSDPTCVLDAPERVETPSRHLHRIACEDIRRTFEFGQHFAEVMPVVTSVAAIMRDTEMWQELAR